MIVFNMWLIFIYDACVIGSLDTESNPGVSIFFLYIHQKKRYYFQHFIGYQQDSIISMPIYKSLEFKLIHVSLVFSRPHKPLEILNLTY